MTIILFSRVSYLFKLCIPCLRREDDRPPSARAVRQHHSRKSTTENGDIRVNDQNSSFETKNRRTESRRISRVISEIHDFPHLDRRILLMSIKAEAKELALFLTLFVIYVLFGAFVFFYIEECSGASMANDSSTPSLTDTFMDVTFKNITQTCKLLYEKSHVKNNTNITTLDESSYNTFISHCKLILKNSANPFLVKKGYQTKCTVDEFQLLKYAEYTIFTLLTIGYGNTTPVTIIGRYILIIYAIFGVPIAVSMYSVAGKLLVQCFTFLVKYVESRILKVKSGEKSTRIKILTLSIMLMVIIILVGCSVTTRSDMENWEFSSSIYFWFVSLTTIGYGDLHFERNKHLASIHFLLISAANLLFGLGIVAAVIESFAMALEKRDEIINQDESSEDESPSDTVNRAVIGHIIGLNTSEESPSTDQHSEDGNISNFFNNTEINLTKTIPESISLTKNVTFFNVHAIHDESTGNQNVRCE